LFTFRFCFSFPSQNFLQRHCAGLGAALAPAVLVTSACPPSGEAEKNSTLVLVHVSSMGTIFYSS
jgi:hypothetical protein